MMAMEFPSHREIKESIDLRAVVEQTALCRRVSSESSVAVCPFHDDRLASS